jgi:hypothetical protein
MVMPSVDMEYSTTLSLYIVETRECWGGFWSLGWAWADVLA